MGSDVILVLVVGTALAFDFTNGFHDTANAVATSIATGALKPRTAVLMSAVLNFAGAFVSIAVAATIAKGIVDPDVLSGTDGLTLVFAALVGAVIWNLITWYLSLPSSSSHALIGGVIGATIVASGSHSVMGHALLEKVLAPAVLSPLIAGVVAIAGTYGAYKILQRIGEKEGVRGYRYGQVGSAALVSLAHGTNDAQKTMGVISLALIAHGDIAGGAAFTVPIWVKLACASAIAAGTAIGGWRIINTMGNRITDVEAPQGFAAESASGAVILASSYYGYPLSTTHVVSGGVMGSGIGKKLATVHWGVAGRMASAWLVTIPAAAVMGGIAWEGARIFGKGSAGGAIAIAIVAAVIAGVIYKLGQNDKVSAADLDRSAPAPAPTIAAVPA